MFTDPKPLTEQLLKKYFNYSLNQGKASGSGIMGVSAQGKLQGPDGDMRYLVGFNSPMGGEIRLFAFDAGTDQWVSLCVSLQDGDGVETGEYVMGELKPNGSVDLAEWKTKFGEPGNPETEKLMGMQRKYTVSLQGGEWK